MRDERCEHLNFEKRTYSMADASLSPSMVYPYQVPVLGPEGCPNCLRGRIDRLRGAVKDALAAAIVGPVSDEERATKRAKAEAAAKVLYGDIGTWGL